jgi:hypothetical protein
MGGAYSVYGGEKRRISKRKDNLGDPGIEGKNTAWFKKMDSISYVYLYEIESIFF